MVPMLVKVFKVERAIKVKQKYRYSGWSGEFAGQGAVGTKELLELLVVLEKPR